MGIFLLCSLFHVFFIKYFLLFQTILQHRVVLNSAPSSAVMMGIGILDDPNAMLLADEESGGMWFITHTDKPNEKSFLLPLFIFRSLHSF